MGILLKQEEDQDKPILYSTGLNQTKLFVGLGNPGPEYSRNRHNIGFMAIDEYAKSNNLTWSNRTDLKSSVAEANILGQKVILVKPSTYMNDSGQAVRAAADYYHVDVADIVVIYDEIDLKFGTIQIRLEGGSAGHNGLKSIIGQIGQGFSRVRVGIGPKQPEQIDLADFVLSDFSSEQKTYLPSICLEAVAILGEATASALSPQTRNITL